MLLECLQPVYDICHREEHGLMWERCFWKAGERHKDFIFFQYLIQHPTEVPERVTWFFRIFFLSLSSLMGL